MNKAIFLDRDGVINKMHYDKEFGKIDTPLSADQIEFTPKIFDFLQKMQKMGFLLVIISNQPGIGIGKVSKRNFGGITKKMNSALKKHGINISRQYYCFHHPFSKLKEYRMDCDCRKPKTKFFNDAISVLAVDPNRSWVIGDGVFDIEAANTLHIKSILIANINEAAYLETLEKQLGDNKPNFMVKTLDKAEQIIKNRS